MQIRADNYARARTARALKYTSVLGRISIFARPLFDRSLRLNATPTPRRGEVRSRQEDRDQKERKKKYCAHTARVESEAAR